ncbi:MAG: GIY-YIG nuclease family protein [Eggerthellaceae bacterium]|jgi:hypothetical protein
MDSERKRALKRKAAEFKPQMGVVSFTWEPTGEVFLAPARNVPALLNRTRLQAETHTLANKRFQELWDAYGEEAMTYALLEELEYQDGVSDYAEDLDVLLEECLEERSDAVRL